MFIDIEDKKNEPEKGNNQITPSSRGMRLGAYALDTCIMSVTLFIGWFIWSFFTWREGTTPGHKLLGQKIVNHKTGATFSWGQMAMREFWIRFVFLGIGFSLTWGLLFIIDSLMIFKKDNRTLHDILSRSIVVDSGVKPFTFNN